MGVQIVKRGRRFEGLTPEGERVLAWAQQMLDDCQRLKQELYTFREQSLGGPFKVGVLPATVALASVMSVPFAEKVPAAQLSIETMESDLLLKKLRAGQLDIALSYLDETPEEGLAQHMLYREQMILFSPKMALSATRISWEQAVSQPLCLVRSSLPNDVEARLQSAPSILWTDSTSILEATLKTGRYATVIPQSLASHLSSTLPVRSYAFQDQTAQANVGFLTARAEPIPVLLRTWLELAHSPEMVKSIRLILNSHKAFARKPPQERR